MICYITNYLFFFDFLLIHIFTNCNFRGASNLWWLDDWFSSPSWRDILLTECAKSLSLYYLMLWSVLQKASNKNDILDGLSIVDDYVQIAINKLHLLNKLILNWNSKRNNSKIKIQQLSQRYTSQSGTEGSKRLQCCPEISNNIALLTHSVQPSMYQHY